MLLNINNLHLKYVILINRGRIFLSEEDLFRFFLFRFWYLSFVACHRHPITCKWEIVNDDYQLDYDLNNRGTINAYFITGK